MSGYAVEVHPPALLGWIASIGAVLALLLVLADIGLQFAADGQQRALAELQAFNAATPAVARINNTLIRALAEQAATHHDGKIKAMLTEAGITYHLSPPPASAATPAH